MKKKPVVYVIHLESPLCHARHYVGYSNFLYARLKHHKHGTGSRFLRAVSQLGIKFTVTALYIGGDRHFERLLHNTHKTAHYCPLCAGKTNTYRPGGYLVTAPRTRAYRDVCTDRFEVACLNSGTIKSWQYEKLPCTLDKILGEG